MVDISTSMLNKYDYSGVDDVCYSDEKCESYKKAAAFLGGKCEDWGCGTGYARHYFSDYRGIDGSPSSYVKEKDIVDLVYYTSNVDNILLRQVLELNIDWRKILENVKKSFKKKFCLVVYTPLVEETHIEETEQMIAADGTKRDEYISVMHFNKKDILDYFPEKEYRVREELVINKQGYGLDWMLYVERIS